MIINPINFMYQKDFFWKVCNNELLVTVTIKSNVFVQNSSHLFSTHVTLSKPLDVCSRGNQLTFTSVNLGGNENADLDDIIS